MTQPEEAGAMIALYVSAATALVLAGAAIGIVVMVCLGIKRDDRPGGFPPTPMTGQHALPGR